MEKRPVTTYKKHIVDNIKFLSQLDVGFTDRPYDAYVEIDDKPGPSRIRSVKFIASSPNPSKSDFDNAEQKNSENFSRHPIDPTTSCQSDESLDIGYMEIEVNTSTDNVPTAELEELIKSRLEMWSNEKKYRRREAAFKEMQELLQRTIEGINERSTGENFGNEAIKSLQKRIENLEALSASIARFISTLSFEQRLELRRKIQQAYEIFLMEVDETTIDMDTNSDFDGDEEIEDINRY